MSAPFCPDSLRHRADMAVQLVEDSHVCGEYELGDHIEADMAEAVRIIWEAAGPMLRAAIRDTVMMGGEE